MGTRKETMDVILERTEGAGNIIIRKMFGEYALYCDGKVTALVCDDTLYIKPTKAGKSHIGRVRERPPYPGAKPWFLVDGDQWDDADWLCALIRITAAELPPPKPKKKKTRKDT